MANDESEARRHTHAGIANRAPDFKQTVWRKLRTAVHPLSGDLSSDLAVQGQRRISSRSPQSIEVLIGVSERLESRQQAVAKLSARPGPQVQDAKPQPQNDDRNIQQAGLRRPLGTEVWLQAFQTLSILLPNTFACIACAWLLNFIFASGNVFSGRSPANQSDFEFYAAVAILGHVIFYWAVLFTHTHVLMPMQFVRLQNTGNPHASILFCIRRLLRHSFCVFLISALLLGASLLVCDAASTTVKGWKVEYYACTFFSHAYMVSITVAVRRIFQQETVQGQSLQRSNYYSTALWSAFVSYMKIYVKTSGKMFAGIFAGMYVQLASRHKITGSWNFAVYTLGSLILKMAIKEVAKFGVMKLNIKDPRSIFAAVGLPTVLIDTQVRVMLQRDQSVNFTILWTIGMAVVEVATRLTKVFFTRRQLRRRESAMLLQERIASSAGVDLVVIPLMVKQASATRIASMVVSVKAANANATRMASTVTSPAIEFERWKRQILAFQIAESYANMSAEYIAIGCSTSILYFCWTHPKYELSGELAVGMNQNMSSESWARGYSICGQVAVEIFVDFISCALEISIGIDFYAVRKFRRYLGLLFTTIAVLNIQICALLYFNDR